MGTRTTGVEPIIEPGVTALGVYYYIFGIDKIPGGDENRYFKGTAPPEELEAEKLVAELLEKLTEKGYLKKKKGRYTNGIYTKGEDSK